ncbi:MAG: diaminopimelate decarboxylase [Clostridia bacterium]
MNFRDTLGINALGHLQIGGCDACDLAKKYGTPLYVMDEDYIRKVARAFRNTIKKTYGDGNVAFASKAFSCMRIYKIMQEENMNIDVVSGGEIFTALKAGFCLEHAYFHGNNKQESELELALDNHIGEIVVDSLQEIEMIEKLCARKKMTQKVLIRTNPGVEAHTHSFIQTANIDSKFGFSVKNGQAKQAIDKIIAQKHLVFNGLHCHIGSQIFDKNAFELAVDIVTDFVRDLAQDYNVKVNELNFGGGFGVHYCEGDPKYNVEEYSDYVETLTSALNNAIEKKHIDKPYFMIEPGRSIVGEAGVTLYTVGTIKEIPDIKKYVNIDGGMTDNIRPALYDAKYEAVIANRASEKCDDLVSVAGKCCESGDIIIKDIMLPKAQTGDTLAVFTTGAYCYAMSSNYNRNLIPPVVFVANGKSCFAVKPQTYDDLVRNDVLEEMK